jgi:hypothetical protein
MEGVSNWKLNSNNQHTLDTAKYGMKPTDFRIILSPYLMFFK